MCRHLFIARTLQSAESGKHRTGTISAANQWPYYRCMDYYWCSTQSIESPISEPRAGRALIAACHTATGVISITNDPWPLSIWVGLAGLRWCLPVRYANKLSLYDGLGALPCCPHHAFPCTCEGTGLQSLTEIAQKWFLFERLSVRLCDRTFQCTFFGLIYMSLANRHKVLHMVRAIESLQIDSLRSLESLFIEISSGTWPWERESLDPSPSGHLYCGLRWCNKRASLSAH